MTESEKPAYGLEGFPEAAIRLQRALERNRHRISESQGLSAMELRALFRVAGERAITPKQLADRLGVTTGAVTGISSRLVAAALVRRVDHPNDRRSIHLELTELGVAAMDRIHDEFLAMVAAATTTTAQSDLSTTIEVIARITERITSALDAERGAPDLERGPAPIPRSRNSTGSAA